jgi:ligand-binding sensor domain-containing protein/signal transduction histidine kinase
MPFRSCFIAAILFTLATGLRGQQQPQLYFERLTTENGLSHNKINCFLQDKRGFMWIGTEDGLNRYDGRTFTIFRNEPGNASSLSGNIITDIIEDSNQLLWIATADGGMTRYDHRLSPAVQFKQYRHSPADSSSIPINIVNTLLYDQRGYLWLGTGGKGVWRFNMRTERFEQPTRKGTQGILDLCMGPGGIIWAGRQGGGLLKINTRNFSYEMDERYANLYAKLPHATVTALFRDSSQHMWYGSWDKVLYRFNTVTGKEEVFQEHDNAYSFHNDEINCFAQDRNGLLWMGGSSRGLQVYDPVRRHFYHYRYDASLEGTVSDDQVNCLYADREGVMWIGTNKGISMNHPGQQQFEQVFLPAAGVEKKRAGIYDFLQDNRQNLWIATSNGIYIYQHASATFRHLPLEYKDTPLIISKFFRDVDGTLYLGSNYSLFRLDEQQGQLTLLPNTDKDPVMNKIIKSRVVSVARDTIEGHPVLLVSPYGHFLAYYDLVEQHWVSRLDTARKILQRFNLTDNLIRKIFKAGNGKIWLATGKTGLGEWLAGALPYVQYLNSNPAVPGSISSDNVYDIAEDIRGNLWLSTYGGGLNYFDTVIRKFSHIPGTENLLEGIQLDNSGHVWMISNGNLHKYDPASRLHFSYRLPDLERSGGISGSIYKDPQGKMYVAGAGYFIAFDPAALVTESRQPEIHFTDFKIFNTSYSQLLSKDEIRLQYNQNYFRIEFAAPSFSPSRNVRYAYQLQGWDKAWVETGHEQFAQFSNLKGGEYLFKVKASNSRGSWNERPASIRIVIVPPFWERWQFYVLLTVLITGAAFGIYRYRVNELLRRQAIRNKIAQDLHDDVGSTLSSIAVYSQVAKIYNEQQQQEALKAAIDRISDTAGEMIVEMNDIVWAINPRNDSMQTILQRMESFARPLMASRNILFHFEVEEGMQHINLGMTRRKNFYLIFRESVNNILKYADCRAVWVKVRMRHHQLELEVQDDGKGFELEKVQINASQSLSGNGLRNMQMRAAEIKGSLAITTQPGHGTTIRLIFPAS